MNAPIIVQTTTTPELDPWRYSMRPVEDADHQDRREIKRLEMLVENGAA